MLSAVLNAMVEGILLIDRDGRIQLANSRVALIGLAPEELVGQTVKSLLEKPELQLAARMGYVPDQTICTPGEPFSYQLEEESGTRYIRRVSLPMMDAQGAQAGCLLIFHDQTEEHDLTEARDDLASMIVHDLRSPLTSVNSGLKLVRDIIPPDDPLHPAIEATVEPSQRAVRKLLNRVNSLLDVSRMERGQRLLEIEPTDLAPLTEHVCEEFKPLTRELEIRLTSEVNGTLPPLNIDSDKVERVLLNLVDNALKFCPSEGAVTIRAYETPMDAAGKAFVRVEVMDTGPGVPDEYKTRLFERFLQIKGRRGARRGIGLGLTFCRLVVEAHGGHIWIEDNPAGGSIFAFTLPVAASAGLE
jgi:PAS domain S-box-containing protein